MKAHKYSKKLETIEHPIDCSLENAIENFVHAVTAEDQKSFYSAFESFEQYQKRLNCVIHHECNVFQQNYINGYKILIEEIQKE